MSPLRLYNTRPRAEEMFVPAAPAGRVGRFDCGPTVYDLPHLAHAGRQRPRGRFGSRSSALTTGHLDIDRLIEEREQHRRNRRFADADRIREQLAAHGVEVEDSAAGVRWRRSTR